MPRAAKAPLTPRAWYTLAMLTLVHVSNAIDRTVMSILTEPVQPAFSGLRAGHSQPGAACCWSERMANLSQYFLDLPGTPGTAVAAAGA